MNQRWEIWVGALGVAMLVWSHYTGLFVAPPEAMMGDVGRILYAHVPTAWVGLLTYLVAFIAAIGALATGKVAWDAMVEATVEVGLLLNVLLLVQGSLWAKPMGCVLDLGPAAHHVRDHGRGLWSGAGLEAADRCADAAAYYLLGGHHHCLRERPDRLSQREVVEDASSAVLES